MTWQDIIRIITIILGRVAEAEARKEEIVQIPIKDLRITRTLDQAKADRKTKAKD